MNRKQQQARAEYLRTLLDAARPTDVYENTEWITNAGIPEALALWDEMHGGLAQAVQDSAWRDANRAEGQRGNIGNRFLREFARTGEEPLDWAFLGPIPVKIDDKRKCRWDSITPDLLEDACTYHESRNRKVYGEGLILVGAMRAIARAARRAGFANVSDVGSGDTVDVSEWRNTEPPLPGMTGDLFDVIDGEVIEDDEPGD